MSFYGLIEKIEFRELIEEARKTKLNDALLRLKDFDPMNEIFYRSAMPEDTPKIVIKKRKNKLYMKKQEKELKKFLEASF